MAAKAILTSRELKNKVTGIDLMVPEFTEKAGRFSKSAVFNVIVVTRLFYYKSHNHKESDVVQFMVQRTYEQFENLYEKLSNRFPSVLFPTLPKKSLIVNSAALLERKNVLDELMHLVARTQKLCCSPMVLEFLGVRGPEKSTPETLVVSEEIFNEQVNEELQSKPEDELSKERADGGVSQDEKSKEEQSDLFVPVDLDSSNLSDITNHDDLFAASNSKKLELHASLFEDEIETTGDKDEAVLFMPAARGNIVKGSEAEQLDNEDTDGLLNVDENVDDLLALSKKSERKSSIKASTSARPLPKSKSQQRTSFEGGIEDEDLSLLSSASTKKEQQKEEDEDLFVEARTKSKATMKEKREKLVKEDTLDDIFGKSNGAKNLFAKSHIDDDLFSSSSTATANTATTMEEDDIAKYINDNMNNELAGLDL